MRARALVLGIWLAGCAAAPTEIIVEVDTTYAVPSAVDELRVEASVAGRPSMSATASLAAGERPPPRTVVLVHRGGPLGPVSIDAHARLRGALVVSAGRDLAFEPGRSLRVRMVLEPACAGISCPASETCADGTCRPRVVAPCELDRSCADAGRPDAGNPDTGARDTGTPLDVPVVPDAPDAGPPCVLDLGVCAADVAMWGDTVALAPCGTPSAGVTVSYSTQPPTGTTRTGDSFVADRAGDFMVTATASAPVGCTAAHTVRVDAFATIPVTGRPTLMRRDLAARPGMAFVATDAGPWAITRAGWRDLAVGAAGTLLSRNLTAVTVRSSEAFFGVSNDNDRIVRVRVAPDFSSIELLSTLILSAGDRSVRAMAVPPGATASGELGPIAVGTKDGVVLLDGAPDTLAARAVGPAFDTALDVTIGALEPANRGAVWALDNNDELHNVATGSGAPFASGAAVTLGTTALPLALALDDRGTTPRLVLCAEDTGLWIYDLDAAWSTLTALPTPVASLSSISCLDVAVGGEGDYWVATSTALLRIAPDGTIRYRSTGGDGLGAVALTAVTTAWDATTREVWVMTAAGDVFVAASDPL